MAEDPYHFAGVKHEIGMIDGLDAAKAMEMSRISTRAVPRVVDAAFAGVWVFFAIAASSYFTRRR